MRTLFHSLAAAVLAVGVMLAAAPAQADILDVAIANAETYLETKYASTGVDQVTLVRSEFGNTTFQGLVHISFDVLFDGVFGGTLTYVPAKAAFDNFVDAGKGYSEPPQTEATLKDCGPGHWFIQVVGTNPENNQWCTPAHLVGKSGGSTYTHTTPAVERECEWTPNFRDTHRC